MKKSLFLWALLVISASCVKEESGDIRRAGGGNDILQAELEQLVESRTTLKDNVDVIWSDGDAITVAGTRATTFTLAEGSGTTSGKFSGDIASAGTGPYFAVYPETGSATFAGGILSFDIAQNRGAATGNIKSGVLPMVSGMKDGSLAFHNLFGLLKITLASGKNISLRKMTLHDLAGNMLWGKCSVPVRNGVPDYNGISLSGGDNTTSIVWENGATLSSSKKSFYFCVPPGALDGGFSVVLYLYDESASDKTGKAYSFVQKITSPVAAERSVVINMDATSISDKSEPLDPKARGYYKTLFVDGGLGLTHFVESSDLPWIKAMGLENDCEYISVSNTKERDSLTQLGLLRAAPLGEDATWSDRNGVLLYPDGKPRFRTIYSNGGSSERHGKALSQAGRDRFHDYYYNGGSYVASCAGAFLACRYVDGTNSYDNATASKNFTYGIFPGNLVHTGMPISISKYGAVFSAIKAEVPFRSFAKGDTLDLVYHHGGGYLPESYNSGLNPQPERLFSYQYTGDPRAAVDSTYYTDYNRLNYDIHGKGARASRVGETCLWAYKNGSTTGRAVLCGSHPEDNVSPSQVRLMCDMINYSLEGNGAATLKATLELGELRRMDAESSDNNPKFAKIGDRQYHHFKIVLSEPVKNFRLTLDSEYDAKSGIDLYLAMRKGGAAWISDADYVLCNKGGQKSMTIKSLPAGTWYIGVFCATTVSATKKSPTSYLKFYSYSGRTETLDGIAYTLKTESIRGGADLSVQDYSGEQISFNNSKLDD